MTMFSVTVWATIGQLDPPELLVLRSLNALISTLDLTINLSQQALGFNHCKACCLVETSIFKAHLNKTVKDS